MKKNHEKGNTLVQTDDYTVPESQDIYFDPGEKHTKKKHVAAIAIIIAVIIGIVAFVTFSDAWYLYPIKNTIGIALDKVTVMLVGDGDNQIKSILTQKGFEKETNVMPFENASISKYAVNDSGVIVARSNYIARYNKKGEVKWETATSISEPILDISGDYIVLADKSGLGVCLYYKEKLAFSEKTQNPIMTVDVSDEGDVVVTTDKEYSKGAVEVFNKTGRQVFSWTSGSEYVLGAGISDSKRRIAVSLLNADENVNTCIQFFDINKTEAYYKSLFENSAVLSAEFIGTTLDITADNCLAGLKVGGETKWIAEYDERSLQKFAMDYRGNKVISLERNAVPYIHLYAQDGKFLSEKELESTPDCIDIMGRTVIYNQGRSVYFGTPGRERRFFASMDVKNLKIIDSSTFLVVYNNSIEFINA